MYCAHMEPKEVTAQYVRKARKRLKLTQKQLAGLLGIKRDSIANYELARAMPPGDVILNLQKILKRVRK